MSKLLFLPDRNGREKESDGAGLVRLSADTLNKEEPGAVVSRFVGDVDTVEALFTSGIISMFADACKIISCLLYTSPSPRD